MEQQIAANILPTSPVSVGPECLTHLLRVGAAIHSDIREDIGSRVKGEEEKTLYSTVVGGT